MVEARPIVAENRRFPVEFGLPMVEIHIPVGDA
jgi:hypothetical protein